MAGSRIYDFYEGRSVFITGATGFMGKVLVEKLLRSCSGIKNLFLLMRQKKGNSNNRLQDFIENEIFDSVREKQSSSFTKLVAVSGDVTLPGFGLSDTDRQLLCQNVSIVFNLAATVRFDEDLKTAVKMNVMGPRELLKICRDMKQLKAMIHVSTAFNNLDKFEIDEVIYPGKMDPVKLSEFIDDANSELIDEITLELIDKCPNTYTYTKALAEQVLERECGSIPVVIVRPSIVTAAEKEPYPGWIDNLNGPTGLLLGLGKGFLRIFTGNDDLISDIIPVDYPINLMIAVAWHTAQNEKKISNIPVYSCSSGHQNPFTWGNLRKMTVESWRKTPAQEMMWYPSAEYYPNNWWFKIYFTLFHYLPGFLLDVYLLLSGQRRKWVRRYEKAYSIIMSLSFFTTHSWKFISNNPQILFDKLNERDKITFNFDVGQIHWPSYMKSYIWGIRKYILKDQLSFMEIGKKNLNKMKLYRILFWLAVLSIGVVLISNIVIRLMMRPSQETTTESHTETDYLNLLVCNHNSSHSSNSTNAVRNWWHQFISSPRTNIIHNPQFSMK